MSLLDEYVADQLIQILPESVVDFGAGRGKYSKMIRNQLGSYPVIVAVEIFRPTCLYLIAKKRYNYLYNMSIQDWLINNETNYDLAIFGDVLEHLECDEIYRVIDQALLYFENIIISIPLYDAPQESTNGNDHEKHKCTISPDFFNRYNTKEKHIVTSRDPKPYHKMNVWLTSSPEGGV